MPIETWVQLAALATFALLLWRAVLSQGRKITSEIELKFDARFDGIDKRLDGIDKRLDNLTDEVRETNRRVDFMYQRAVEDADRQLRLVSSR